MSYNHATRSLNTDTSSDSKQADYKAEWLVIAHKMILDQIESDCITPNTNKMLTDLENGKEVNPQKVLEKIVADVDKVHHNLILSKSLQEKILGIINDKLESINFKDSQIDPYDQTQAQGSDENSNHSSTQPIKKNRKISTSPMTVFEDITNKDSVLSTGIKLAYL